MREAAIEAAKQEEDEPLKVALEEEEVVAPEQHTAGEIPPVQEEVTAQPDVTASQLGFDDLEQVAHDAKQAVALLVVNDFGGDYKQAFSHYDRDSDGGLSMNELTHMLRDAGLADAEGVARGTIGEDEIAMDSDATLDYAGYLSAFEDD